MTWRDIYFKEQLLMTWRDVFQRAILLTMGFTFPILEPMTLCANLSLEAGDLWCTWSWRIREFGLDENLLHAFHSLIVFVVNDIHFLHLQTVRHHM